MWNLENSKIILKVVKFTSHTTQLQTFIFKIVINTRGEHVFQDVSWCLRMSNLFFISYYKTVCWQLNFNISTKFEYAGE